MNAKITRAKKLPPHVSVCNWKLAVDCTGCGAVIRLDGQCIDSFKAAIDRLPNIRCDKCTGKASR